MSTENKQANIREYQIRASSIDTFGRLLCNSRHHHFVVDGPTQNGCPGEALTPPEIFLAGVVTCGVELVQVFAKDKKISLGSATGTISATLDRSNQTRSDITLFNSVRLDIALAGAPTISPVDFQLNLLFLHSGKFGFQHVLPVILLDIDIFWLEFRVLCPIVGP